MGKLREAHHRAGYQSSTTDAADRTIRESILLGSCLAVWKFFSYFSLVNWTQGTRDWIDPHIGEAPAPVDSEGQLEGVPVDAPVAADVFAVSARNVSRLKRARFIDFTIIGSIVGLILLLMGAALRPVWATPLKIVVATVVSIRVIDILQAAFAIALFDPIRYVGKPPTNTSIARVFLNSMANLVEVWLAFALFSWLARTGFSDELAADDAVYHAYLNQLTLGSPIDATTSLTRFITGAHMAVTLLFVLLVIGRWVTSLSDSRQ